MSTHRAVHLSKVCLDIRVSWECAHRMPTKTAVVEVALIQDLMDHLAEVDLHGLRGNKAVVAKIAVLSPTLAKGDDVGSETQPRTEQSGRVRNDEARWGEWRCTHKGM